MRHARHRADRGGPIAGRGYLRASQAPLRRDAPVLARWPTRCRGLHRDRLSRVRTLLGAAALLLLGACALTPRVPPEALTNHSAPLRVTVDDCAQVLAADRVAPHAALGTELAVAVWNAKKGRSAAWRADFDALLDAHDLILLQEFYLQPELVDRRYWTFSAGFETNGTRTGVVTLSRTVPLAGCALTGREPILGTRKATSITAFALEDGRTLVVVNLHVVNFSVGLIRFREQLESAIRAVAEHDGPLIFSGDFNTWRRGRVRVVDELLATLDLEPVAFAEDLRVKRFGHPLDHLYVRDLEVLDATTRRVRTSDHNPLLVRLAP